MMKLRTALRKKARQEKLQRDVLRAAQADTPCEVEFSFRRLWKRHGLYFGPVIDGSMNRSVFRWLGWLVTQQEVDADSAARASAGQV